MSENAERLPQQNRSRVTAERFIAAAFKMLEKQTFAELAVGDLANAAKRSVGSFYQRFGSKEEFLKILIVNFLETGIGDEAAKAWQADTPKEVYAKFLEDTYYRILNHRNLWHAVLEMSASDPGFWSDFGSYRERRLQDLMTAIEKAKGKKLSQAEMRRLAVAGQVFNSVMNNQIINSPGPLALDDKEFLPAMAEIALNVADLSD
ncbi:TetR/AcrR family transcriptional regulator [Hyphococcus sp.]|jgi:AcrR family transcriptional regulator|uniref:TetR/AcrR family transcriptional regulator n=1 Tax=Hyphococcus sp. TaxID=2038636 RepID=UPI003D152C22